MPRPHHQLRDPDPNTYHMSYQDRVLRRTAINVTFVLKVIDITVPNAKMQFLELYSCYFICIRQLVVTSYLMESRYQRQCTVYMLIRVHLPLSSRRPDYGIKDNILRFYISASINM